MKYDPARAPDPEPWLALDEAERLCMIEEFHENAGEPLPEAGDWMAHAALHLVVENQIALNDPPEVAATVERLMDEGLTRHSAIHAIAFQFIWTTRELVNDPTAESFDETAYVRALESATAESFLEQTSLPGNFETDAETRPGHRDHRRDLPGRPVRSSKVRGNGPCPCGSGRKYKKCCGRPT